MSEFKADGLGALFKKLAEELEKNKNTVVDDDIKYPIQVEKLDRFELKPEADRKPVGGFVKIRPCAKEYENKTYLGIYLGEFPVGSMIAYNPDRKDLSIVMKRNPAIFVPDLSKIIYGMESWWGNIDSEDDLSEITDKDISNVWYVKALGTIKEKKDA